MFGLVWFYGVVEHRLDWVGVKSTLSEKQILYSGFGEHLETHSGENSNKCNKWDDSLHSGGKENLHFNGNWFLKEF